MSADAPATEYSPDFSTCRNCGVAIGWDDYSYTHMDTGFAECGTTITGGEKPKGKLRRALGGFADRSTVNTTLTVDPSFKGSRAEPVEWGQG